MNVVRHVECPYACEWTPWAFIPQIADMDARRCLTCGMKELRVYPVPVRQQPKGPSLRDEDMTWNGTREEGE